MEGASLVRICGAMLHEGGASKPHSGVNGDYQRSDKKINGRAVYIKVNTLGTAMWWSNNDGTLCWCVGPREDVGGTRMWCYVESKGFGPEEAAERAWLVYSYDSRAYDLQTGVVVQILDGLQDSNGLDATSEDVSDGTSLESHRIEGRLWSVAPARTMTSGRPLTAEEIEADRILCTRVLRRSVCPQPPPQSAPANEVFVTPEEQRAVTALPSLGGHAYKDAQISPIRIGGARSADSRSMYLQTSPRAATQDDFLRATDNSSSPDAEKDGRESVKAAALASSDKTVLGMTYRRAGGFAAVKQLAVASLGTKAEVNCLASATR